MAPLDLTRSSLDGNNLLWTVCNVSLEESVPAGTTLCELLVMDRVAGTVHSTTPFPTEYEITPTEEVHFQQDLPEMLGLNGQFDAEISVPGSANTGTFSFDIAEGTVTSV